MKRILFASIMAGIAACAAPSVDSDLVSSEVYSADCFTALNPAGAVVDGAFEEVHFYNGNCSGETKALNKISMKKDVLVVRGSDRVKSALYLDGKTVSVKIDGEALPIGELVPRDGEEIFDLASGVAFDLMVYDRDGNARAWKLGDTAPIAKEEIAVFL